MCISVCWCCLLGCLFLCCRLPIWKRRHVPSNVPTYFEESSSVGDYERWVYKKHYWAVNFIQLTHDVCHILSHLPVIVTLSSFVVECAFPSSPSVPSSSLHTHTAAIPQYVASGYAALLNCLHSPLLWDVLQCHDDLLTKKHVGVLDSSNWDQSMVSCQEPLTVQLVYVTFNDLLTKTSNICRCNVIPWVMTTRSMFMVFISGVKCSLNTSNTTSPIFSGAPLPFFSPLLPASPS